MTLVKKFNIKFFRLMPKIYDRVVKALVRDSYSELSAHKIATKRLQKLKIFKKGTRTLTKKGRGKKLKKDKRK